MCLCLVTGCAKEGERESNGAYQEGRGLVLGFGGGHNDEVAHEREVG